VFSQLLHEQTKTINGEVLILFFNFFPMASLSWRLSYSRLLSRYVGRL